MKYREQSVITFLLDNFYLGTYFRIIRVIVKILEGQIYNYIHLDF